MKVRIYQPAKTAMQSGRAKSKQWILEFVRPTPQRPEPLMGWSSSGDTANQVQLRFDSREEAIEYAEQKGWQFEIGSAHNKKITPRNYGDNFRYLPPS